MTHPRISIVVPVYNGAIWLTDTLESIRRQTVPPAEVVVVDDGSSDGSAELAQQHPLAPRVVRLGRNHGVAFARNTGLLETTGEFVAFLDQDDLWLPERLARLAAILAVDADRRVLVTSERVFAIEEDRAELELAQHPFAGWVEFWRPRTDVLSLLDDIPSGSGECLVTELPMRRLLSGSVTVTTSYVLPRVLALQVGGFPAWLRSADDWLLLQALSRHTSIFRVDDPTVLYRIHPSNTSVTTEWSMPLMVSAAAARFGGGIVARDAAREPERVGALVESDFLMHQLTHLAATRGLRARLDSFAVWQLLATDRPDRLRSGRRLASVIGRSVLPSWLKDLFRRPPRSRR